MKKSFFIALAIYLIAGAVLWQLEWPKHIERETKSISLASLTIKKSKCTCRKCNCKSHVHKQKKEVAPFKKPPRIHKKLRKASKSKLKKQRLRQKKRKVVYKKSRKKVTKKIKKSVIKKIESHDVVSKAESQTVKKEAAVQKTIPAKSAPQTPVTKPSYQEQYIQKYANAIRQAIQRHKFYPRIARKTKKQGVVELYFELTPKKELRNLTITRSSGHAILDRAAIKCVRSASKEFPSPKECVKVKVPIEYRLR